MVRIDFVNGVERQIPTDCSGHLAVAVGGIRSVTGIKAAINGGPIEKPVERGARITVEFGERPPARRGILDRFGAALDVLRDKPGEWASIAHYPSRAGAWYPRRELQKLLDDFEFDVRSTSSPEGSVLWACFIGES